MTRDEAANVLQENLDKWYEPKRWLFEKHCKALEMAIATLREPAHEWVRSADKLPMVKQQVLGLHGGKVDLYHMVDMSDADIFKRYVKYWCAIPHLPEVDE